jgi:LAO/AO transport system kinase
MSFISSGHHSQNNRKEFLLAEKAYKLIQQKRMAEINKTALQKEISNAMLKPGFNLYAFVENFL